MSSILTPIFPRMKCSINGKAIAAFATFCTVLVYLAVGAAIFQVALLPAPPNDMYYVA